ncbi:MAG TPA: MmgE/PrpD family protein [Acidimicrobiales bacterium]|nr:MmgE/PrpD family protein [Acidimicrobiales bacterium]
MSTTASSTARLATEAAALRFAALPPDVVTLAKHCLLDAVGVGLAGAGSEAARIAASVALEDAPDGQCSILGRPETTNASGAALANGTAIHALDYDDMSVPLCGHPTAPLLPAVLALGELSGASGEALLTAFAAGYEAECRLGAAVDPSHYARGFHATATIGTVGAAVGAGHLLGLGAEALERAIGIAATQAAGLKSMFGTMCKPLHAGRAAASGILAARLARDGFTSAPDALAAEQGFAATMADDLVVELLEAPFGEPWHLLGNLFKFHAACYFTHGTINAMLGLREAGVRADEVREIIVRVTPGHLAVCNIAAPTTGLEAKFSLRFAAASALATGRSDESAFTDERAADPLLVGLQQRVRVQGDDSLGPYDTVVTIETAAGRRELSESTARPAWRVDPEEERPLLEAKFQALSAPVIGSQGARALAAQLLHLETLDDVRGLRRLLAPTAVAA